MAGRVLAAAALASGIVLLLLLSQGERESDAIDPRLAREPERAERAAPRLAAPRELGPLRAGPSASARVEPNVPGLHGRVVEGEREAPVARAIAWVEADGEVLARAFTDRRGRFVLPLVDLSGRADVRVGVTPPRGYSVAPDTVEPGEDALAGVEELRFVAKPLARAPVRGLVVYEESGDPLPFLDLVVMGPGAIRDYPRTDELGRFETEGEFLPGTVRIAPGAPRGRPEFQELTLAHLADGRGSREIVVRARTGPTFRLDLLLPGEADVTQLVAQLVRADDPSVVFTSADLMTFVRPGDPPWVRFGATPDGEGDWRLEVVSWEHEWAGRAVVAAHPGFSPDSVRIDLRPAGSFGGVVGDAAGAALGGVRVSLAKTDRSPPGPLPGPDTSDAWGNYGFDDVAGGWYRLRLELDGYRAYEREVEVVPGEYGTRDVRLARAQ